MKAGTPPRSSHESDIEDVRWAWSAPRPSRRSVSGASSQGFFGSPMAAAQPHAPVATTVAASSSVAADLQDVLRVLSTTTMEVQTDAPSFTLSLGFRTTDESGQRHTTAVQAGTSATVTSTGTQVNEPDVVAAANVSAVAEDGGSEEGNTDQAAVGDADQSSFFLNRSGVAGSSGSAHRPHSDIPAADFPVHVADARALGVFNQHGFVSLPRPPVALPPRRSTKAIAPADYPHLYGTHGAQIEETSAARLDRAHSLWVGSSGFVPKF